MADQQSSTPSVRGRARGRAPANWGFGGPIDDTVSVTPSMVAPERASEAPSREFQEMSVAGDASSGHSSEKANTVGPLNAPPTTAVAVQGGSGTGGSGSGRGSSSDKSKGIRVTIKDGFNKVGVSGQEFQNVVTNYMYMNQTPDFHLHQYRVDFEPDENETSLKKLLLRSQEKELPSYIFDGHMLYTTTPIAADKRNLIVPSTDNKVFKIFIKTVGYVLPDSPMFVQFYNMIMRKCMTLMEMEELGRHFYDRHQAIRIEEEKLQLWPGIVTAIRNHQLGMLLCVEVTHKVLRMTNVLEYLCALKKKCTRPEEYRTLVERELVGTIVMTHYNRMTYKVDAVDFEKNPLCTFIGKDGETSYEQYYKTRYNVKEMDLKQPLLVSYPKKKDINQGRTDNIYLIPSLCNPTGLTDDMRKDFNLMRKLSAHLHMGPKQRKQKLDAFVGRIVNTVSVQEEFKKWNINFIPDFLLCTARKFPQEKIFMGPDQITALPDDKADWTRPLKSNGMLLSTELNDWIVFVPTRDHSAVDGLLKSLRSEGGKIRVHMNNPIAIVKYEPGRATHVMREEMERRKKEVKFAFIILPSNALKLYADVKRLFVLDFGVACQCFLAKHLRPDPKTQGKLGSICSKVMIQINAKQGGVPWGVKIPLKGLMVLGFDVYHCSERKNQSAGALVSTTDQSLNKYHSSVAFHKDKSELAVQMTSGIRRALEAYMVENGGALPDQMVLFRDGVGEGQINYVLDYEIPRIRSGLETVSNDRGVPPPKLSVVIVTKKINSRAMLQHGKGPTARFENLQPGTVIDNTFTLPERYDFFLVSQSVNQGTVSPTNYNVVLDESNLTPDHMQKLSYKLCHLYYNWCGTVAVPAPCQYAHKLAYLTGVALNEEAPAGLATNLWYL